MNAENQHCAAGRSRSRLQPVVKCLAHVIYWPLRIAGLTICVLLSLLACYVAAAMMWVAAVSMWNNWKTSCVWTLWIITGGLTIAAYEWAKHKIGRDT